jgi:hypothetical protein
LIPNKILLDRLIDLIFFCSITSLILKFENFNDLKNYFIFSNYLIGLNLKFESDVFSFIFGFLFLFYFFKKSKLKFVILLLLIFLTAKRIVFIAIFFSLICNLIPFKKLKYFKIPFLFFNFLIVYFLYFLNKKNSPLEDIVQDIFSIPIIELNTGRSNIYQPVLENLNLPPLFGYGIGKIQSVLNSINGKNADLFHSDILKLSYEFGLLGYLFLVYLFYKFSLIKPNTLPFVIMLLIFMISDNILTYFPVMSIFFLIFIYNFNINKNQNNLL